MGFIALCLFSSAVLAGTAYESLLAERPFEAAFIFLCAILCAAIARHELRQL